MAAYEYPHVYPHRALPPSFAPLPHGLLHNGGGLVNACHDHLASRTSPVATYNGCFKDDRRGESDQFRGGRNPAASGMVGINS